MREIYVVVDPTMEKNVLIERLDKIIAERPAAVQVWDHFPAGIKPEALIHELVELCAKTETPVFINNRWELLLTTHLQGVHFDTVPTNLADIRRRVGRPFITGVTVENNLETVQWAAQEAFDYISFCSMFPSSSATSCDLVSFDTVRKAKALFPNKIYLAGGIRPSNVAQLATLPYDGIAVIAGLMNEKHPVDALNEYKHQLTS